MYTRRYNRGIKHKGRRQSLDEGGLMVVLIMLVGNTHIHVHAHKRVLFINLTAKLLFEEE